MPPPTLNSEEPIIVVEVLCSGRIIGIQNGRQNDRARASSLEFVNCFRKPATMFPIAKL